MPGLAKAAESGLIERSWLAGPHEIGLERATLFVYKLEANWSHPATGGCTIATPRRHLRWCLRWFVAPARGLSLQQVRLQIRSQLVTPCHGGVHYCYTTPAFEVVFALVCGACSWAVAAAGAAGATQFTPAALLTNRSTT